MTRRLVETSEAKKRPIDFLSGWPNPALLPPTLLDDAAHTVLSSPDLSRETLKYAPDEGYLPLRKELAKWLAQFYQPNNGIDFQRLCVTGGASQNLACVLQTFTDPIYTRNVWMVAPTYFLACRIIDDSGFAGRLKAIPEDEQGIDIEYLREHIKISEEKAMRDGNTEPKLKSKYPWRKTYKHIIYAVPNFANPSGRLMSLERREALVKIARDFDALIVTDDVYDMLQWPSEKDDAVDKHPVAVLPRIVDVDRYLDGGPSSEWGNAMSNGSFSKIVAPGCRTGWAESTPKLAWALSQCGSSRSGGAPSQLVASMIHQMIASGQLHSHIVEKLLPAYRERYTIMQTAIEKYLSPLGIVSMLPKEAVLGGYFSWLNLPSKYNAEIVRKNAFEEEQLQIIEGPRFKVEGDEKNPETKFDHHIRLCFAYESVENIEEGVRRLAQVIQRYGSS